MNRLASLSTIFQTDYVDVTFVIGLIKTEMRMMQQQFIDDPDVNINAGLYDAHEYRLIPDYGPIDGQLAALRASLHGSYFRSIKVVRKLDG
mgnify:FL=1